MNEMLPALYCRKRFDVEAVQVTPENMADVAKWCNGDVIQCGADGSDDLSTSADRDYIKVKVSRPLNEKQTRAFSGDWVLKAGTGFKVYTDRAMKNSFEPVTLVASMEKLERHLNPVL